MDAYHHVPCPLVTFFDIRALLIKNSDSGRSMNLLKNLLNASLEDCHQRLQNVKSVSVRKGEKSNDANDAQLHKSMLQVQVSAPVSS